MAPNNYISTYSGDFGGRKSKSFSFTGGKQGPSLVARQGKDISGFCIIIQREDYTDILF